MTEVLDLPWNYGYSCDMDYTRNILHCMYAMQNSTISFYTGFMVVSVDLGNPRYNSIQKTKYIKIYNLFYQNVIIGD